MAYASSSGKHWTLEKVTAVIAEYCSDNAKSQYFNDAKAFTDIREGLCSLSEKDQARLIERMPEKLREELRKSFQRREYDDDLLLYAMFALIFGLVGGVFSHTWWWVMPSIILVSGSIFSYRKFAADKKMLKALDVAA